MKNLLLSAMIFGFSATGICQTTEQTEESTATSIKGRGTIADAIDERTGKQGSMVFINNGVELVPGEYVNIRNNGITKIIINDRGDVVGEIVVIDELVERVRVLDVDEPIDILIEDLEVLE
ncbi:MAG: hypothetical protein JKY15_07375 [Deltaproteobacteria bacterium]|nr:hypothetical protein [Deltaproteobacteria bacterium]